MGAFWRVPLYMKTRTSVFRLRCHGDIRRQHHQVSRVISRISAPLRTLSLYCWDCVEESITCTDHSPTPLQYPDANLLLVSHTFCSSSLLCGHSLTPHVPTVNIHNRSQTTQTTISPPPQHLLVQYQLNSLTHQSTCSNSAGS